MGEIVIIELTVGEYRADCSCCKTFRSQVDGIEPRAEYTNRVRDVVIDRLLEDGMSLNRLQPIAAPTRSSFLNLSDGFLYDCLDWKVRQPTWPGLSSMDPENFSGILCIDELHLGHRTLLLATDPLGDFPSRSPWCRATTKIKMRRFLLNLRNHGFLPEVVVTDGSNLYPNVLAGKSGPPPGINSVSSTSSRTSTNSVLDSLKEMRRKHGGPANANAAAGV